MASYFTVSHPTYSVYPAILKHSMMVSCSPFRTTSCCKLRYSVILIHCTMTSCRTVFLQPVTQHVPTIAEFCIVFSFSTLCHPYEQFHVISSQTILLFCYSNNGHAKSFTSHFVFLLQHYYDSLLTVLSRYSCCIYCGFMQYTILPRLQLNILPYFWNIIVSSCTVFGVRSVVTFMCIFYSTIPSICTVFCRPQAQYLAIFRQSVLTTSYMVSFFALF